MPPVLLPFQQRWLEDRSRVKIFEKSRRIGATWCSAADSVLEAASGRQDVWYVSYTEDSAKEFITDAARWCRHFNIVTKHIGETIMPTDEDGQLAGVRVFGITFPSDRRITALTSNPRNLRGKQGRVIIDEAAFHQDLRGVLKAAMALLVWGGEVWILSTHRGVDNFFNRICEDVRDQKRSYSLHRVTITDALSEGLYRRICEVLGRPWSREAEAQWLAELEQEYGDGVREELYCEPERAGVSYLPREMIERAMEDAPVLRVARDAHYTLVPQHERTRDLLEWADAMLAPLLARLPHLPHALGWDFGRYADRSVLAPFTLEQNLVRRCPLLLELQNVPHNDQWTLLRYVIDRLPRFFRGYMDAGGNGSWIAEQALIHYGAETIVPVDLSLKWYANNMPPFKEGHERGLIRYPRDLDVRDDLTKITRIEGVPRLPKDRHQAKLSEGKRHGDAAIALCLGYAALGEAEAVSTRWSLLSAESVRDNPWSALYADV